MIIFSGYSGIATQTVDLKASVDTALELLPYDFKQICEAFKSHLGISAVTDRLAPEWTANSMIMIELVGNSETRGAPIQTFTFNFHILKVRAQDTHNEYADTTYALTTLSRLRRLLTANGNLNSHCGLQRIDQIDIVTGSDWAPELDPEVGQQLDGGTLRIQYTATSPEPFRIY